MAKEKEPEKLAMEPPETGYVTERYVISVPITNQHLEDPWKLRLYASELINKKVGDEVQLTAMKVKKPGQFSRGIAKLRRRVPNARLYVTTKF